MMRPIASLPKTLWPLVAVVLILPSISTGAARPDTCQLAIEERAGVDRTHDPVQCGIPLPRFWNVTDVASLRLTDDGTPVPAQFRPLARWGAAVDDTTAPVKWVLVNFSHSISKNATDTLTLDRSGPGPEASQVIRSDNSVAGYLTIDTGAAIFKIHTTGDFNLIQQVTIDGQQRLSTLSGAAAIDADLSIAAGGTPDTTARSLAVEVERPGVLCTTVKATGSIADGSGTPRLDYTVRLHFYAGSAAVRLDFTVENNHPVIANDAGQPTNVHDQCAVNSVYVDALKLALKPEPRLGNLRVMTESGIDVDQPASSVRLYQDSSGGAYWSAFNHVTVDPVAISSAHGYTGTADQTGSITLESRRTEHQYNGVSLP